MPTNKSQRLFPLYDIDISSVCIDYKTSFIDARSPSFFNYLSILIIPFYSISPCRSSFQRRRRSTGRVMKQRVGKLAAGFMKLTRQK